MSIFYLKFNNNFNYFKTKQVNKLIKIIKFTINL